MWKNNNLVCSPILDVVDLIDLYFYIGSMLMD